MQQKFAMLLMTRWLKGLYHKRMGLFEFFGWSCLLLSHLSVVFLSIFSEDQSCPCSTDEIFRMIDLYLGHGFLMVHFQYLPFFLIPHKFLTYTKVNMRFWTGWYHSFPVFKTVWNDSVFICFIERRLSCSISTRCAKHYDRLF